MSEKPRSFKRFSPIQRFEHLVLIVAFLGLIVTGLPQKYADKEWARTLISLMDGVESARVAHRAFAILLLIETIYHLVSIGFKRFVLGQSGSMIPSRRDLRDAWDWLRFNLRINRERPKMPYYNFAEKLDYWIVFIGVIIMAITGLIMWNPIAVSDVLPGEIIPAARRAHGGEAIFLLLAILTWHLYGVLIKQFNLSMFTGRLSEKQMQQEHAAVLESEGEPARFTKDVIQQRRQRFYPVAVVLVIVLIGGLTWFLTSEDTALETVPRQEVRLFAPEISLDEGNAQVGEALWGTLRCARCHGENAAGIPNGAPSLRGTALTFDEFLLQVREGEGEMPAFTHLEISDVYALHLWTWLASSPTP